MSNAHTLAQTVYEVRWWLVAVLLLVASKVGSL